MKETLLDEKLNYDYDFEVRIDRARDYQTYNARVLTNEFGEGNIYIKPYYYGNQIRRVKEKIVPINLRGKGLSKSKKKVKSITTYLINKELDLENRKSLKNYLTKT